MKVNDASLQHKDQVCTLIHLKKGIKMDKQSMHIDSITFKTGGDLGKVCFLSQC